MNIQEIQAYLTAHMNTQGFVNIFEASMVCQTNQIVLCDIARNMGMDYGQVGKQTVLVKVKAI